MYYSLYHLIRKFHLSGEQDKNYLSHQEKIVHSCRVATVIDLIFFSLSIRHFALKSLMAALLWFLIISVESSFSFVSRISPTYKIR